MTLDFTADRASHWMAAFVLSLGLHVGAVIAIYQQALLEPAAPTTAPIPLGFEINTVRLDTTAIEALEQAEAVEAVDPLYETATESSEVLPGEEAAEALTPAELSEPDALTAVKPDEAIEPEEVAALAPDPADTLAPVEEESPEPLVAETLTPVEDPAAIAIEEQIAALEPETLAPVVEPEPATVEEQIAALQPETLAAEPPVIETPQPVVPTSADEPLSPLQSTGQDQVVETVAVARAETVAPVTPPAAATPAAEAVSVRPEQIAALGETLPRARPSTALPVEEAGLAPETVAPAPAETDTLAARQTLPDRTVPAPRPGTPPPAAPPVNPALQALVDQIRARLSDACLLALPENRDDGPPRVTVLAAQEAALEAFTRDVVEPVATETAVTDRQLFIDERQCPALRYARANPRYPALPVSVGLASSDIESGQSLVGVLGNVAGRYTSLLIVD
ncbi:MAG: hypothetical protein AAFQ51_16130, partial [Pseudomonadota bacterium]